jgi:hypothetical protein
MTISRERLADLLIDPREELDCEIKNWLDLRNSNDDKATFAKAALALANHGGGFIIFGLTETAEGIVEADQRPVTLDDYNQDLINGIIQNYSDPPFHCSVYLIHNSVGAIFPIVVVPGGHRVPVTARRAGPNGNTVSANAIYIRKPGPRSETPQNAREWDELLGRCLTNRRDEMFSQIRDLISGAVPQVEIQAPPERLFEWTNSGLARWADLTNELPAHVGAKFPFGRYYISYEIIGERRQIDNVDIPELIRGSVVRHTGWPPFWYPTRAGITPYPFEGVIECWLGGDPEEPPEQSDAAHSDFWRIDPNGLAFLMRGFQEDDGETRRHGAPNLLPGTCLDVVLPIWRVGEALLHARSLAARFFHEPTTIKFQVVYEGLAGRSLISINGNRDIWANRIARQNSITLSTHFAAQSLDQNLPEIVHPLLAPLYNLFDFFDLPMQMVSEELQRLRAGRY